MSAVGLNFNEIIHAFPLPATAALVRCYNDSLEETYLAGFGSLYGTEVSDLQIVSSIGEAVKRATGAEQLPWVDIHVKQEPEHVENVDLALSLRFNYGDSLSILRAADKMWSSWIDFFESIGKRLEI